MENLKAKYEIEYLQNKVERLEQDVEFWKSVAEKYASCLGQNDNSWFEDNKRVLNTREKQL